jgi:type VI secretion system protein
MAIEITVVKSPEHINLSKVCQIFTERGGTIGRGEENTWVIEDPDRFISSTHMQIVFENGHYYLSDVSTNGTFLNGSPEPIGNGNRVPLKDGDVFSLSDYEFQVNMRSEKESDFNGLNDPFSDDGFSPSDIPNSNLPDMHDYADPFASSAGVPVFEDNLSFANHSETDPLAMLDKAGRGNQNNPFLDSVFNSNQSDHADAMQHAVAWPNAIPDDWDEDIPESAEPTPIGAVLSENPAAREKVDHALMHKLHNVEHEREALEKENTQLLNEIMQLKQKLKNMQNSRSKGPTTNHPSRIDETLLDAMGLGGWTLSDAKKADISTTVGLLMREAIAGLMQTLSFRKKIKEEFRINVTTIQPIENNPLKFSANIEDALENMFIKENKAYMRPVEAVKEGFQGISEHQIALLAGIQAAFRGMLERLDPEALEKRFEKYRKTGVIKVGQRSKNWESYKEFHQDLVNNIDNSFQYLFGYDFVQAYEEQLQRLVMSRKSRTKKK